MCLSQVKKYLYILVAIITLGSCSEYQQLLRKGSLADKVKAADAYYNEGDYKKAFRLYELIVPAYRGKPQAERILFHEADTYYNLEDFYISQYKFERFAKAYPKSKKIEEARYKEAKSIYELTNRYSLDQKQTFVGLEKFQKFINDFPESSFLESANEHTSKLRNKLEEKFYKIAKQYHHRDLYKPAIKAFSNYLVDYPGSKFSERVLYYRLESAYKLAINSFEDLIPERLDKAQEYYETYITRSVSEDFKKKADEIAADINKRKQAFNIQS